MEHQIVLTEEASLPVKDLTSTLVPKRCPMDLIFLLGALAQTF